jgi:hypothetical protein
MLDIHPPDWILRILIDWDEVIDHISLESTVLIIDDVIKAIFLIVLGYEQGFVVLWGHQVDLSQEVRNFAGIFDLE